MIKEFLKVGISNSARCLEFFLPLFPILSSIGPTTLSILALQLVGSCTGSHNLLHLPGIAGYHCIRGDYSNRLKPSDGIFKLYFVCGTFASYLLKIEKMLNEPFGQ